MKTGRSLSELAAELDRQVKTRRDFIAPQGQVEAVVEEGVVKIAGLDADAFPLRPHASKQLADVLGIPVKYYDRMSREQPMLLAENVNTWLRADPENKRMMRTLDGSVRAILTPKYRPLDNYDILGAVLPKLIELEVQIVSADVTETRMYVKAILPSLSDELPSGMTWGNGHNAIAEYRSNQPGRVVAAINLMNSEVGAGALRVEPSVFTTWCTNLAILKEASMRKYHVGRSFDADSNLEVFRDETRKADDRAFFMKVADVAAAAFDRKLFSAAVEQIRNATTQQIDSTDLSKVVETAVKILDLPTTTSGSILTYLAMGGDLSKWGLASAITAASSSLDDYETATSFERAGGEVITLSPSQWSEISKAA